MSDHDLIARLRRLDCCAVSDALDKLGLTGVVAGLPQRSGEGRIAGRAVTVKLGKGEAAKGPVRHLGTAAVEASGPDNIIVVEQHADMNCGSWGGLLSLGAKLRGVQGVVCDGPVRDIDEARAHGFPVFAEKLTARTGRGRVVELGTNVPVDFCGIAVHPGDYVIADNSAIIFIAAAQIEGVLDAAERIAEKEAAMANALMAGEPITKVMGANYETMLTKN